MGRNTKTMATFKNFKAEVDALTDPKEDGGKAIQAYV